MPERGPVVKSFLLGAVVFTVLTSVCVAFPASDAQVQATASPQLLAQATPSVSADQAAALVRAKSGGRVLGVRRDNNAQPTVYRVKGLLDGGRVRVYRVDASTGQILQ